MDKNNTLNTDLKSALSKAKYKLLPLVMLMFALSILDRSNLGYVKSFIEVDAGISATAYALGAGIFFIGYAIFEIPSNLILHRVGARVWLSRIMVSWGIVTMCMVFIKDEKSFYILRFLLGVTEAGFSPGVILYMTYWFPAKYRSQAYGLYYLGVPIALMLGGPISGALLELPTTWGIKGWHWMFLVEGGITVVVGVFAFFWLVSKPEEAKWLSSAEKKAVATAFEEEEGITQDNLPVSLKSIFKNLRVWQFVLIYFSIQMSVYGVLFYLPTKIASLLGTKVGLEVGLYTSIPWIFTLLMIPIVTRYADKNHNWQKMAILMLLLASLGMALSTVTSSVVLFMLIISIAICGFIVVQPLFWNLPTQFLSERALAGGTALIGAMGNLGGFVAPQMKNGAEQFFNNAYAGYMSLAIVGLLGVLLLLSLKKA